MIDNLPFMVTVVKNLVKKCISTSNLVDTNETEEVLNSLVDYFSNVKIEIVHTDHSKHHEMYLELFSISTLVVNLYVVKYLIEFTFFRCDTSNVASKLPSSFVTTYSPDKHTCT